MIGLADDPRDWDSPEYRQREHEVIDHLGRQYVFDRHNPERLTAAPDFGLPKLVPPWGAQYLKAVKRDGGWSWQTADTSE